MSKKSVRRILMKNPVVTRAMIEKFIKIPAFRRRISRALNGKYRRLIPIKAHIPFTIEGKYVRFRIEEPKKFDKSSFRVITIGRLDGLPTKMTVACPRGKFIKGKCRVGTKPQSLLIPIRRVIAEAGKYAKIPATRLLIRKIAANPMLMVAQNKKRMKKNPLLMVAANPVAKCPFKVNADINIVKFEKWLYANGNPEEMKRYKDAKKSFVRFHLGAMPKTIKRSIINIGGKRITDRDFLYNAGKAPATLYKTPGYSGKADNNAGYIHHWKDKPDVNITRDGKTIINSLTGKAKIDNWMRG